MEKAKIVEVVWLDTYHVGGGLSRKEVAELKPAVCYSYGRLIEDTDDHVTIASNILEHSVEVEGLEYRDVICVPKTVVQSIRELK